MPEEPTVRGPHRSQSSVHKRSATCCFAASAPRRSLSIRKIRFRLLGMLDPYSVQCRLVRFRKRDVTLKPHNLQLRCSLWGNPHLFQEHGYHGRLVVQFAIARNDGSPEITYPRCESFKEINCSRSGRSGQPAVWIRTKHCQRRR